MLITKIFETEQVFRGLKILVEDGRLDAVRQKYASFRAKTREAMIKPMVVEMLFHMI